MKYVFKERILIFSYFLLGDSTYHPNAIQSVPGTEQVTGCSEKDHAAGIVLGVDIFFAFNVILLNPNAVLCVSGTASIGTSKSVISMIPLKK